MHELPLDEAAKNFAAVIKQVISGEEIVLTDRESPVAKIVSFHPAKVPARRFGCLKGLVRIGDDFDEPLEDFKEYVL